MKSISKHDFILFFQNAAGSSKVQPEGPPILASLGLTPRSDKVKIKCPHTALSLT